MKAVEKETKKEGNMKEKVATVEIRQDLVDSIHRAGHEVGDILEQWKEDLDFEKDSLTFMDILAQWSVCPKRFLKLMEIFEEWKRN